MKHHQQNMRSQHFLFLLLLAGALSSFRSYHVRKTLTTSSPTISIGTTFHNDEDRAHQRAKRPTVTSASTQPPEDASRNGTHQSSFAKELPENSGNNDSETSNSPPPLAAEASYNATNATNSITKAPFDQRNQQRQQQKAGSNVPERSDGRDNEHAAPTLESMSRGTSSTIQDQLAVKPRKTASNQLGGDNNATIAVAPSNQLSAPGLYSSAGKSSNLRAMNVSDYDHVASWIGAKKLGYLIGFMFRSTTGYNRLCEILVELIREVILLPDKDDGNDHLQNATERDRSDVQRLKVLVNISLSCQEMFQKSGMGTGNVLQALYAMRLAVAAANTGLLTPMLLERANLTSAMVEFQIDLNMECWDAEETKASLILPWIMGQWFADEEPKPSPYFTRQDYTDADKTLPLLLCGKFSSLPLHRIMHEDVQYDLRRMAVALVGLPSAPNHGSVQWARKYIMTPAEVQSSSTPGGVAITVPRQRRQVANPAPGQHPPLHPKSAPGDEFVDDAVIHFRCGDYMNIQHRQTGFIKFCSYANKILNSTESIGIVTQPFPGDLVNNATTVRELDLDLVAARRCEIVVNEFVAYLQERFPNAQRIRIHNNPHGETTAISFARIVMARHQVVIGFSTFGVVPAIVTFGESAHIRTPWLTGTGKIADTTIANAWLEHYKDGGSSNLPLSAARMPRVDMFPSPRLASRVVYNMWKMDPSGENVIDWFRNDTCVSKSDDWRLPRPTDCWKLPLPPAK